MRYRVGDRSLVLVVVVDVLRSATIPSVQQRIRRSNARGRRLFFVLADRHQRIDGGFAVLTSQVTNCYDDLRPAAPPA